MTLMTKYCVFVFFETVQVVEYVNITFYLKIIYPYFFV